MWRNVVMFEFVRHSGYASMHRKRAYPVVYDIERNLRHAMNVWALGFFDSSYMIIPCLISRPAERAMGLVSCHFGDRT
jgi:hypothetical protein